jgi:hypothetical protein
MLLANSELVFTTIVYISGMLPIEHSATAAGSFLSYGA